MAACLVMLGAAAGDGRATDDAAAAEQVLGGAVDGIEEQLARDSAGTYGPELGDRCMVL